MYKISYKQEITNSQASVVVLQSQVKKKKHNNNNNNEAQQNTNRECNAKHTESGPGHTQFFSTIPCRSVGKVFTGCNSYQPSPGHISP